MTREETSILKGIAILLMLYLHLFMGQHIVIDEEVIDFTGTLTARITNSCNPVAFFLILSGFGLYKLTHKESFKYDLHKRNFRLYLHYWISLAIFIPIGYICFEKCPNQEYSSVADVWHLLSGWESQFNHSIWFLLPYILMALLAPLAFKLMDRYPKLFVIVIITAWLLSSIAIAKLGFLFKLAGGEFIYLVAVLLSFLFPFCIGGVAAKYDLFSRMGEANKFVATTFMYLLFVGRIYCPTSLVQPFYAFILMWLYLHSFRISIVDKVLAELGRRSTSMWFIHCYFCYYYFTEQVYSLRNPILMYVALIVVSYLSAIILDTINSFVQKRIGL